MVLSVTQGTKNKFMELFKSFAKKENLKSKEAKIKMLTFTLAAAFASMYFGFKNSKTVENVDSKNLSQDSIEIIKDKIESAGYEIDEEKFESLLNEHVIPSDIKIRCIDGRRGGSEDEATICIPGAGAGILLDALDYAEKLKIPEEKAYEIVKSVIGKITAHTDEHNKNSNIVYGGCGHVKNEINKPEYGIDGHVKNYINLHTGDLFITDSYQGEHEEKFVTVINNPNICIPSKFSNSETFVYNKKWHKAIMDEIAIKLSTQYNLDMEKTKNELWNLAVKHTNLTVSKLAGNLPVYEIN